ncbi:MAG: glycosyltransferase family 2 protein [Candidatus Sericytochromatia bacterium]|nr:glycosyltransferase family 2 protein [Candidatus Sericytochromatia bacterium]
MAVERVGVVLVSWHSGDTLAPCLASLPASAEVVVVDNAGEAGFAERLERLRPGTRLLVPGRNLGFGRACNLGVADLATEFVLLLNPDARLEPGALALLVEVLRDDPSLAAVGPAVAAAEGGWERTWGEDPSFFAEWRERRRGRTTANRPTASRHVPWLSGCCVLLRRAVFEEVGGFDPGYFLYYEDADLGRRMRYAGFRLCLWPTAGAWHGRGASTGRLGMGLDWYRRQSQVRYYRKFNGPLDRLALALRLAMVLLPRCLHGPDAAHGRALLRRLIGTRVEVAEADFPGLDHGLQEVTSASRRAM